MAWRKGPWTRDTRWDKQAKGKLRLISVPHTGTVFTRYVLASLDLADMREGGGDYLSHHTYEFDNGLIFPPESETIVVPLRDPMLAEASRINRGGFGGEISDWTWITRLARERDVHFFRVEVPQSSSPAAEIRALAAYVGREAPHVEWEPKNVKLDSGGLKEAYYRGEIAPEMAEAWEWLRCADDVRAFFADQGYDLPWMSRN